MRLDQQHNRQWPAQAAPDSGTEGNGLSVVNTTITNQDSDASEALLPPPRSRFGSAKTWATRAPLMPALIFLVIVVSPA